MWLRNLQSRQAPTEPDFERRSCRHRYGFSSTSSRSCGSGGAGRERTGSMETKNCSQGYLY